MQGRGAARAWIAGLGVTLLLACCSRPQVKGDSADGFDRGALLASEGEHVILPAYRVFHAAALRLQQATAAHASAVAAGPATAELAAAQEAWHSAMAAWQYAEVLQIGPAGTAPAVVAGKGLRDSLYAWPTVNTCRVDQEVVAARYEAPDFFTTALVNVVGLATLEYLLFNDSPANTCPPQVLINANGAWAALNDAERTQRRAAYAAATARFLAVKAAELRSAWEPGEGNFVATLARAGSTTSVYTSAQSAIDQLFAAMFYIDFKVKDRKLAVPAGIDPLCATATCPEALESPWAKHSGQNITANLRGFQALFLGNTAADTARPGFDDLLVARGAAALATQIAQNTVTALAAAEALPGGMEAALAADSAHLQTVHAAVKKITDALKSQMVTVLGLKVPQEGAADND